MDNLVYEKFFAMLRDRFGEREYRLASSALAIALPRGGISLVSKSSGLSRPTIYSGMRELEGAAPEPSELDRQRKAGGGRKALGAKDATLESDLGKLVSPHRRGDPESPLAWTSKSLRKLAEELNSLGHSVGHVTVGKLLEKMGFTLQSNKKSREGRGGPSGPRRAVHAHRPDSASIHGNGAARHFSGCKKERTRWKLQEQRTGVPSERRSGRS